MASGQTNVNDQRGSVVTMTILIIQLLAAAAYIRLQRRGHQLTGVANSVMKAFIRQ